MPESGIQDGVLYIAMQTNNAADAHVTFSRDQYSGTCGISIGSETTYGLKEILCDVRFDAASTLS